MRSRPRTRCGTTSTRRRPTASTAACRASLHGVAAGGVAHTTTTPIDFSKEVLKARPQFFPEEGTDLEKTAMRFHAVQPSELQGSSHGCAGGGGGELRHQRRRRPGSRGAVPRPCIDDVGVRLNTGVIGTFFSGETLTGPLHARLQRVQRAAAAGVQGRQHPVRRGAQQDRLPLPAAAHHFAVGRRGPGDQQAEAAEPLVMRLNTFDCAVYSHSNLVPKDYEIDDYQVRTPTDIIGQHIHLPVGPDQATTARPTAGTTKTARSRPEWWSSASKPSTASTALPTTASPAFARPGDRSGGSSPGTPVLRPVRPSGLDWRAHHDAALVCRPGGQHRRRGPRPGNHLHA